MVHWLESIDLIIFCLFSSLMPPSIMNSSSFQELSRFERMEQIITASGIAYLSSAPQTTGMTLDETLFRNMVELSDSKDYIFLILKEHNLLLNPALKNYENAFFNLVLTRQERSSGFLRIYFSHRLFTSNSNLAAMYSRSCKGSFLRQCRSICLT